MTALTGYLKDTAEPAMEKLIRSGEILASRVQGHQETIKVFENQSALLRETLAPVFQQLEVKPSPLSRKQSLPSWRHQRLKPSQTANWL
ncbi:hypothetical protein [Acetobacter senegalensis]|uniref:hypothetical protein n=1 Tax=Acetobacter senegalensis TaxID=446692 RepID=UPI000A484D92|nr:hypothetical protein [Acetobacter senegalensis]